jgi:pyruvate dehydrogenase E1 component alpha subunit
MKSKRHGKHGLSGNGAAGIMLLRMMKFIRQVEETIASRYAEGKMRCPTHLSTGQEATAAGVCLALTPGDQVMSTHRSHAHYLAKGGELKKMLAEIYGKATGCCGGRGGSMHIIAPSAGFLGSTAIVGNSIPIAVGAALTNQMLKTGKAVCVFFGDAAVEEGVFHEAANFAVLRKLGVLFICENNLYSVYSPLSVRQPANRKIWRFAASYGMPSAHGDGNDAMEVYNKAKEALAHIRRGVGPYFLEFATYRWREHCGPAFDNDLGYRSKEEFRQWQKRDPIPRLESSLLKKGVLSAARLNEMQKEIEKEIENAFKFAEDSPFPDAGQMKTNLFAD